MENGALLVLHFIAFACLRYHKFMADSFVFSLFFEFWGSSLKKGSGWNDQNMAGSLRPLELHGL